MSQSQSQPKSHPWSEPLTNRQSAARRHSVAFSASVISSLRTATVTEVAAAAGLTRGAVTGIIASARRMGIPIVFKQGRSPGTVPELVPEAHVHVLKPTPKKVRVVQPKTPVVAPDTRTRFGTGVSILDVRTSQCRALDDMRECCCQPTLPGSSWCAGHRALYVATSRRAA